MCINQADDEEKFQQINQMNVIYKEARKVWAWLGLATDQSYFPRVLSLLPTIIAYNKQVSGQPRHLRPERPSELRDLEPVFWETVIPLFRNPWFERVWVVQEAALAKDIAFLCGEHEICFETLSEGAAGEKFILWNLQEASHKDQSIAPARERYGSACVVRKLFQTKEAPSADHQGRGNLLKNPIRAITIMADNLQCFAPQDRIFGALALLKEMDPNGLHDYTHGSTTRLYVQFSTYTLTISVRDSDWWKYINSSFTLHRREGLPSWVPDLHYQRAPNICYPFKDVMDFCNKNPLQFQASTRATDFAIGQQPDEIVLQGRLLDEVGIVHPMVPKWPAAQYHNAPIVEKDPEGNLTTIVDLVDWENQIAEAVLVHPSEDSTKSGVVNTSYSRITMDTYWRTLARDERGDGDFELNESIWSEVWTNLRQLAPLLRKTLEVIR